LTLFRAVRAYFGASLNRKVVLAVVTVLGTLIAVLTWQAMAREARLLDEQSLTRAEAMASLLATSGEHWMLSEDLAGLGELVESASAISSVRYAMFVNGSGRVLAHSDERRIGLYVRGRGFNRARPGLQLISMSGQSIDVAAAIEMNGRVAGWAWISLSLADVRERQQELAIRAIGFGAVAILLTLLAGILIARGVARRVAELVDATDHFRLGDHSVRVVERGSDEVTAAARGVNAMFEAVASGERSLKQAQRIARLGTWRNDGVSLLIQCSEVVEEMFGFNAETNPPTFANFLRSLPDEQQALILSLKDDPNPRTFSSFNLDIRRPDGTVRTCWNEVRTEIDRVTGYRAWLGVCQDITDREAAAEQLRQAQKMEAVGQLTGGIAHDFNNLLAIIIGNLDLLEEDLAADPSRELVTEALSAALRGSELNKQLLAFSRRQPLAPTAVDLNQLISGISALWRRTVGEAIDVRIHLAKDLWLTRADPSQVESAILNLVINARDAMPDGGAVTVETRNQRLEAEMRGEDDVAPGDYSVITVSDTGLGMSPETVAHAFEPFFTTKPIGQGTGLGLSMIYGFARQSGGDVRIYSEQGHGTAVSIYLPRADERLEARQASAPDATQLKAAGETIMLVEDDDGVRRTIERHLEDFGYRVVSAASGAEALMLLTQHPHVQLLFTDIVMPGGMSGAELTEIATRRNPALKVLHTSGFTRRAIDGQIPDSISAPLLTKPYRKSELAAKLRQVLDAPAMSDS
jgi:signal transduction histidine kinase/ActR/RegA family two-component response regulator/HAMP domain-containing protein